MATEAGKGLKRLHQARLQEQDIHTDLARLYADISAAHDRGDDPDPAAYALLSTRLQEAFLLACDSARAVDHTLTHLAPLIARRLPVGDPRAALIGPAYSQQPSPASAASVAATAAAAVANIVSDSNVGAGAGMGDGGDVSGLAMTDDHVGQWPASAVSSDNLIVPTASSGLAGTSTVDLFVTSDGSLVRPESPSLPLLTPLLPAPALRRGDLWSWHLGPPATAQALPVGLEVAALADAENDLWIVGRIAALRPRVPPRPQIYEVVDVEQELLAATAAEGTAIVPAAKRLALTANRLIPLPSLREFPASSRADFVAGNRVLALYPVDNVSSLYPCEIIKSAKKRGDDIFEVRFDDDGGVVRKVSAKYVVPVPQST